MTTGHALFLSLCGLACRPAAAQVATDAPLTAAVAAARQHYAAALTGQPQLYNGPEYTDYARRYRSQAGHQFFLTPARQPGSVYYNGQLFDPVELTYDIVRDQVVLAQPTSPLTLRLVNERVRYFTLGEHRFVRLVADSTAGVLPTGYYEVLVGTGVQVLARRAKSLRERVVNGGIDVSFEAADKLFVRRAGTYYAIGSQGALLPLLADHGPQVQQYLKDHKLRFGPAQLESSAVQLVQYYNTLAKI